jgi:anaerobic nitric oxide reductase flavorubredoxin
MMPKVAGMLEEITGLRFKGKKAGAFGSYGWNGGAVDRIHSRLTDAGFFTTVGLKTKWRPDSNAMEECREHGRKIAREWALQPLTTVATTRAVINELNVAPRSVVTSQPVVETVTPATNETAAVQQEVTSTTTSSSTDQKQKQICTVCQWIYDPELGEPNQGVEPKTAWEEVPDSFLCPECGIGKQVFEPIN